ncbi:MAG TPA: diaminopimelate epimerase [Candidatus Polarisedimenticolia bacterium]|nr:diaminopimelate epimerase [Candidatus Polarisedimenticolia bacterium]
MSATPIKFTKMSAGGNDFIVIDNITTAPDSVEPDPGQIRRMCARALSVGADGVILIGPPDAGGTVRMVYHNSDGGRADLCGNGVRCVARFSALKRIAPPESIVIETDVGPLRAGVESDRAFFTLPLGAPRIEPRTLELPGSLDEVSRQVEAFHVTVGVPHLVVPIRDAHGMPGRELLSLAPRLRRHPDLGPEGANIDFITVRDRHTLDIRCYERGVEAETLSSGSGCIASALAARAAGLADSPIACRSRTGLVSQVRLEDGAAGTEATLSGDARVIYTGVLHDEALTGFDA